MRALQAVVATLAVTATGLVAGVSTLTPAAGAEPARSVELRVASYNIHHGAGADGTSDLSRTLEALRVVDADVIGLQEVDVHWGARSQWRDLASDMARALDMRVFFAPIYDLDPAKAGEPRRRYGLAILSRFPIVAAENHEITRLSTQGADPVPAPAPGFPEVVVNVRGARVHVYNTHLDYRADPSVRELQVKDTLRILAADPAGAQQVLVGDLNARPNAPELAPLWDRLRDAWDVAGGGQGPTYPAGAPTKRIDYVTVSSNVTVTAAHVPPTLASDHLPVIADLTVTRGR